MEAVGEVPRAWNVWIKRHLRVISMQSTGRVHRVWKHLKHWTELFCWKILQKEKYVQLLSSLYELHWNVLVPPWFFSREAPLPHSDHPFLCHLEIPVTVVNNLQLLSNSDDMEQLDHSEQKHLFSCTIRWSLSALQVCLLRACVSLALKHSFKRRTLYIWDFEKLSWQIWWITFL